MALMTAILCCAGKIGVWFDCVFCRVRDLGGLVCKGGGVTKGGAAVARHTLAGEMVFGMAWDHNSSKLALLSR